MSIGRKIAERRKELKMTQQDLAESLDVTFQAVSSWERDEYLPETDRLKDIAGALSMKVSELFEEEGVDPSRWELHDAMFSISNMEKRVRDYARAKDMPQTLKALRLMKKAHEGQVRKGKDQVPYIIHPLMLACHGFALGIDSDELIATCLLHDVIEDCNITAKDIPLEAEVIEAVELLTFRQAEGMSEDEYTALYYKGISKNKIASIVKLLDRCNNISTMATAFSKKKMASYIDETEKYVFPLLDIVKHEYDEYYNASFLLKYQLLSVMESIKRMI